MQMISPAIGGIILLKKPFKALYEVLDGDPIEVRDATSI